MLASIHLSCRAFHLSSEPNLLCLRTCAKNEHCVVCIFNDTLLTLPDEHWATPWCVWIPKTGIQDARWLHLVSRTNFCNCLVTHFEIDKDVFSCMGLNQLLWQIICNETMAQLLLTFYVKGKSDLASSWRSLMKNTRTSAPNRALCAICSKWSFQSNAPFWCGCCCCCCVLSKCLQPFETKKLCDCNKRTVMHAIISRCHSTVTHSATQESRRRRWWNTDGYTQLKQPQTKTEYRRFRYGLMVLLFCFVDWSIMRCCVFSILPAIFVFRSSYHCFDISVLCCVVIISMLAIVIVTIASIIFCCYCWLCLPNK